MRFPGVQPAHSQPLQYPHLLVAAVLYVAVDKIEPNRRHATALKLLIIALEG